MKRNPKNMETKGKVVPAADEVSKAKDDAEDKWPEKPLYRRWAQLLSYLKIFPFADQVELAKALGVSDKTIHRYLERLKNDGMVKEALIAREAGGRVKIAEAPRAATQEARFRSRYTKFLVMIQTSYDRTDRKASKASVSYQEVVKENIEKTILDKQDGYGVILGDVDIMLGGGDFDIVVCLYAKDGNDVHELVTRHLRKLQHVTGTATCWCYG